MEYKKKPKMRKKDNNNVGYDYGAGWGGKMTMNWLFSPDSYLRHS